MGEILLFFRANSAVVLNEQDEADNQLGQELKQIC